MKILLVANYAPDRQESMLRYASVLGDGLARAGHDVRTIAPAARVNRAARPPAGLWKWVGYVDKLVTARGDIQRAALWADLVHVCDHSNAFYVPRHSARPWVVTCHDLLALRGALGEDTDCPASATGRVLQRTILAGLRRAHFVAADSGATLADVRRIVGTPAERTAVVPPPLNYPYRVLSPGEASSRLTALPELRSRPYALVVGSNLRRKNREAALRVLARTRDRWPGVLAFAGESLSAELREQATRLGIIDRVFDVPRPSGELLEALYNGAHALLFPSRFEGYGWPPLEAQACGCPVISSDAPPMPEVAGDGALLCALARETEFDDALLALAADPALRADFIARGLRNAARYDVPTFVARFTEIYETLA